MFKRFGSRMRCIILLSSALLVLSLLLPAQTKSAQAQDVNLVTNGTFENADASWDQCGDTTIVDTQSGATGAMVHSGRYAARISYNRDRDCGGEPVYTPDSQIAQPIIIPPDAQALTISFWYSRVGATTLSLQVILGTEARPLGWTVSLDSVKSEELAGWNLYRGELSASQLNSVRGKTLNLYVAMYAIFGSSTQANANAVQPEAAEKAGFYIDDVRVVTASERTQAATLPAALKSDGSHPLLVFKGGTGIVRMNTDGSEVQNLTSKQTTQAIDPAWSSDGRQIASRESSLVGADSDITVLPAFITLIKTMSPNGQHVQEVYRTAGLPGKYRVPNDPADPNRPALDVEINALDWSPDNRSLVFSICARNRDYDGATSDPICYLEVRDVATGNLVYKADQLSRARWSSTNRIIAQDRDNYGDRADGIWEIDMNSTPPTETLLVPGTGTQYNPSSRVDTEPSWSPDGKHFATVRNVAGYHFDGNDSYVFHKEIMLFDYGNPVGRAVLLVDQGADPASLSWSPNGAYLLYDLQQGNSYDIWWIDVSTGTTGKLTNDGNSIEADWRPPCSGVDCNGGNTYAVFVPLIRR